MLDLKNLILMGILLLILYGERFIPKKKVSPFLLIIISACAGIMLF